MITKTLLYELVACTGLAYGILFILLIHYKKAVIGKDEDIFDRFINRLKTKETLGLSVFSTRTYLFLLVLCPVVLATLGAILTGSMVLTGILFLSGLFVPELLNKIGNSSKKRKFEVAYISALDVLSASLLVGKSIEQSVEEVAYSAFVEDTIKSGFLKILSDIRVNISVKDAFEQFARDADSEDAMDVASAIAMQAAIGGNEADAIQMISKNISERVTMKKEIASILGSTTVMVWALDIIPLIVLGILFSAAREFVQAYFESFTLTVVLVILLGMIAIGSVITHKMESNAKEGKA